MSEKHQLNNNEYLSILNNLHDGLYFVDNDRKITYWNKAAERISGYSAEEVIGRSCADSILTHIDGEGNYLCQAGCPLEATIADGELRETTVYMHHKMGHRVPVLVRTSPLTNEKGEMIGGIEIFTDVSSQEGNELRVKELEKLALLDTLTNLANRRYVEQEIENRLSEYQRFSIPFGILFMDIDHFKNFNDSYGHDVGDDVLRYVANTFVQNSRPFDLYGRWGGEEFVAVIKNVHERELKILGERDRQLIEQSYIIHNGEKLQVTISIGATLITKQDTIDTLVKRADDNLYKSKADGRNRLTLI